MNYHNPEIEIFNTLWRELKTSNDISASKGFLKKYLINQNGIEEIDISEIAHDNPFLCYKKKDEKILCFNPPIECRDCKGCDKTKNLKVLSFPLLNHYGIWGRFIVKLNQDSDITNLEGLLCSTSHFIHEDGFAPHEVLENAEDGILSLDENHKIVSINNRAAQFFKNYLKYDLSVGMEFIKHIPERNLKNWEGYFRIVSRGNSIYETIEVDSPSIQHVSRFFELCFSPIRMGDKVLGLSIIIRDVTEKHFKESINELKVKILENGSGNSSEIFTTFLDTIESITESEIGFYHFVKDEIIQLKGWSTNTIETMCKMKDYKVDYPLIQAGCWADAIRNKSIALVNDVNQVKRKMDFPEGHTLVNRFVSIPIIRNDEVVAVFGVGNKKTPYTKNEIELLQNIGDETWDSILQKDLEDRLKDNEETLKFILEDILMGYWDWDLNSEVLYLSPHLQNSMGGKNIINSIEEFVHPSDRPLVRKIIDDHISSKGNIPFHCEVRIKSSPEHYGWVILAGRIIEWGDREKPKRIIGCIIDISKRKKSEELGNLLLKAIEQLSEELIITNKEGNIQYVNPAFERLSGYTSNEVIGKNPNIVKSGIQNQAYYSILWKTITEGKTWRSNIVNRKKNGDHYTLETLIAPIKDNSGTIENFISIRSDKTETLELESKLRQREKMDAIGHLAGGIAHDFNNILTGIMGYTELSMLEASSMDPLSDYLTQIQTASMRAKKLVSQILSFSRQNTDQVKPIHLKPVLDEVILLLRATLPSSITIKTEIEDDQNIIEADSTRIHEILMNLCMNASFAMDDKGILTIKHTEMSQEETISGILGDIQPGIYSVITIDDTGCGIPQEIIGRIFEPFFTTKKDGKGSGLGLSVVFGVLQQYHGNIRVNSTVEKGTEFKLFFPKNQKMIDTRPEKCNSETDSKSDNRGTILLVDDEVMITKVLELHFRRIGYTVHSFNDSEKAFAFFDKDPSAIDIVITDQTMPNLTGLELSHKISQKRKELPIILCSGYSTQISEDSMENHGIDCFLKKPVSHGQLDIQIRRLLKNQG